MHACNEEVFRARVFFIRKWVGSLGMIGLKSLSDNLTTKEWYFTSLGLLECYQEASLNWQ